MVCSPPTRPVWAGGDRTVDEVDVRDWLGGTIRAAVSEDALGLGSYGRVLTVLTSGTFGQDADAENDEDNEEALVESWTPLLCRWYSAGLGGKALKLPGWGATAALEVEAECLLSGEGKVCLNIRKGGAKRSLPLTRGGSIC